MKNYKNIKRIFESDEMMAAPQEPMAPQAMPMPNQEPMPALPPTGETAAPADPMIMTVGDFIAKCKEIDPLVCMGIESFIEKNREMLGQSTAMPMMPPAQEPDLTFSNAVAPQDQATPPAPAQNFSLDQSPEALNFPA